MLPVMSSALVLPTPRLFPYLDKSHHTLLQPQLSLQTSPLLGLLQLQPSQPPVSPRMASPSRSDSSVECTTILLRLGAVKSRLGPFVDVLAIPGVMAKHREPLSHEDTFPFKLYQLLSACKDPSLIRFVARGRAFSIRDKERFAKEILPKYYKQTKFGSFQRQLHNYGFERVAHGPYRGAYYHELFVKGLPGLLTYMKRAGVLKGDGQERGSRTPVDLGQLIAAE